MANKFKNLMQSLLKTNMTMNAIFEPFDKLHGKFLQQAGEKSILS